MSALRRKSSLDGLGMVWKRGKLALVQDDLDNIEWMWDAIFVPEAVLVPDIPCLIAMTVLIEGGKLWVKASTESDHGLRVVGRLVLDSLYSSRDAVAAHDLNHIILFHFRSRTISNTAVNHYSSESVRSPA